MMVSVSARLIVQAKDKAKAEGKAKAVASATAAAFALDLALALALAVALLRSAFEWNRRIDHGRPIGNFTAPRIEAA